MKFHSHPEQRRPAEDAVSKGEATGINGAEVELKTRRKKKPFVDFSGLRRILKTMTVPARRHRCPECKEVAQCHICTIQITHQLHWDSGNYRPPLFCAECAFRLGLDSVLCCDEHGGCHYRMYDYQTGAIIWEHSGFIGGSIVGTRPNPGGNPGGYWKGASKCAK